MNGRGEPFTVAPLRESQAPSAYACGFRWLWRGVDGRIAGHTRTREDANRFALAAADLETQRIEAFSGEVVS